MKRRATVLRFFRFSRLPKQFSSAISRSGPPTISRDAGLGDEDAKHVREVSQMLFLQDDLRIRSAAYAMLPSLDLDKAEPILKELEYVQSVVAYCYSSPHPTFGDPFFHFENASLVVLSPEGVSEFLVRPEHHVDATDPSVSLGANRWHNLPGYRGLYNFRQHFWVAKTSRIYPPRATDGIKHFTESRA